jgi:hypothetical protein
MSLQEYINTWSYCRPERLQMEDVYSAMAQITM